MLFSYESYNVHYFGALGVVDLEIEKFIDTMPNNIRMAYWTSLDNDDLIGITGGFVT